MCERIVNYEYLYRNRMMRIAVLEFIAVGYVYLTISFRFSQGWRAYGYCSTNEYANCDHEYLFVAILNVTCAFSAFLG